MLLSATSKRKTPAYDIGHKPEFFARDIFDVKAKTMSGKKVFDVRGVDKSLRKKIIFKLFHELKDGKHLELISNHSLAPLYKIFQKEKQDFFTWDELENGPEVWKISIRKMELPYLTINEIVSKYPMAVEVLEQHGIAYYKLGPTKLVDVSPNAKAVFREIRHTKKLSVNPLKIHHWTIGCTINYIINNHHAYIWEVIPEIEKLIGQLINTNCTTHPQFAMIQQKFSEFKTELEEHLRDEEEIVFPSFIKLEKSLRQHRREEPNDYLDAIHWMEEDHILASTSLMSIRNLCDNYVAHKGSLGFETLYEELRDFEYDMHFHMHLENNILFSKVINTLKSIKNP